MTNACGGCLGDGDCTDPAFPAAFPWVESEHYWSQHVEDLRQQLIALDAPPLPLY